MLGLVLGGGGAKGYAHIGVIKVLEEEGIKPDVIVGSSMGSLVGGFYAAGFTSGQLTEIVTGVDKKKKRWLFPFIISNQGLIDPKNIVEFLKPYISDRLIENLPVRYAAVATDIENRQEIIIQSGDLINAIRASISVPLAFTPSHYQGRVLIDGGLVNPVPVSVAKKLDANKIIAVNVLRKLDYKQVFIDAIAPSNKTYSIKKVILETLSLVFSRLIDYEIEQIKKGIVMHVDTSGIGISHFEKGAEAIIRGYAEADKYRSELGKLLRTKH